MLVGHLGHHFVNHLVNQGMLDPNEYFADFELGNEVVYGMGSPATPQPAPSTRRRGSSTRIARGGGCCFTIPHHRG